jgi:hypothetical protein
MAIPLPNFVALDSTSIAGAAYDSEHLILSLQFRNGAIYSYFDVQPGVYQELLSASSKGTFFHCWIRSRFRFHRLL